MNEYIGFLAVMNPPKKKENSLPGNAIWIKIVSTFEHGDKVVEFSRDTPKLDGFIVTHKDQVTSDECNVKFGDATCLGAFYRQAPGEYIGCGETWALLAYM